MSNFKSLLPGVLTLLLLALLIQTAGLPAWAPTTVDLGFEDILLIKGADDIPPLTESNSAAGLMRVAGHGVDIAQPRFIFQSVATLPDLSGSEGAIAFVLLSIASGVMCLFKKSVR